MKQKKMLVLTVSQLKQIYTQEMPELVEMAAVSPTVEDFKAGLLKHLDSCGMVNEVAEEAREQIRLLLQYDGQDRKSTRLNSSHITRSRMPSSA